MDKYVLKTLKYCRPLKPMRSVNSRSLILGANYEKENVTLGNVDCQSWGQDHMGIVPDFS